MARPRSASTLIPARQTGPVGRHRDALASRLPVLRAALDQQRGFRREQLALLDACGGTQESAARANPADSRDQEAVEALREVDALVAAGARRALADIDLALLRMDTGRYGLCRSCGARIPLVVLEAIPKTTLCLTCQPQSERSELEDVLNDHPGVRQSAVYGVRRTDDAEERIHAAVVPTPGAGLDERRLQDWMRDRRGPMYVPARITFTDVLPLTDAGKPDKNRLRAADLDETQDL